MKKSKRKNTVNNTVNYGAGAAHNHSVLAGRRAGRHTPRHEKRGRNSAKAEIRRQLRGE